MIEAERAALEWLENVNHYAKAGTVSSLAGSKGVVLERHVAAIKALLARPTLPEEPTPAMLAVMRDALIDGPVSWVDVYARERHIYAALRAELIKPPAPVVGVIDVWYAECVTKNRAMPIIQIYASRETAEHYAEALRQEGAACVRVTGPHKHVVLV